jgi:leader peptidase (prepilin peptidase) / N-methyltransferase
VTALIAVVCGLAGLVVGSFLNVVVHRVPRHESIVSPGSHCPACDAPVGARDNVPVVSWVLLRGACRSCGARISPRYPATELLTSALFVAMAVRFGPDIAVVPYCLLAAVGVAVSAIDVEHMIVPRRIIYVAWAGAAPMLAVASGLDADPGRMLDALVGAAGAFAFFAAVHLVSPRGMGFGDVRLAGLLGLYLGWLGLAQVVVGFFLAFLLGSVVGVWLVAAGRKGRQSRLCFAPFLVAGAILTVWFGGPLTRLWLG